MPRYCAAFGCTNHSSKDVCREKKISFHAFPVKEPECKEWLIKVRRANFVPNEHSVLCSEHFTEDCFIYQPFTNRRGIKPGAIPTLFSYTKASKRKQTSYEFGRADREPNHDSRLCSCHFEDGKKENNPTIFSYCENKQFDYQSPEKRVKKREGPRFRTKLKKNAVPSLNLPISSCENPGILNQKKQNSFLRLERIKRRENPKQNEDADNLEKNLARKRKKMQSKEIPSDEVGNSSVECLNNQKSSCFNLDEKDNSESVPAVSVKVEEPWEKESEFMQKPFEDNSQDCDKLQIEIKEVRSIPSSFSAEAADENKTEISEKSSHFGRPLKILKREKIFGTLVASELSDLSINPELYLKTKQAILDILIQAHFELINCDS